MHEQSETIQLPDGRWVNVYGHATPQAGQPLPNSGNFSSSEEAVSAAKARSASHGRTMDIQTKDGILLRGIPDGTPDDEIKARIQKIRAGNAPPPKVAEKPENSMWDVARNAAVEGVAGIPDMFLNAPNRLANLAQMPKGIGALIAGRPDLAPEMNPDPDLARKAAIGVGAIDPNVVPQGAREKIVDALVRGGVGGGLTGGAGLGKALVGAGMGATSSLAATGAQEATDSPVAGVLAGLAVPGAAAGASAASRAVAPKLMQSALKPSAKDVKSGNAKAAIETLFEEGLNATKGGSAKLQERIATTNEGIKEAIGNSSATISKTDVASRLHDPLERAGKQVNPKADIAAVERVWSEFTDQFPGQIPVQLAQELKQGTYQQLKKKYGEMGSMDTEAQKALARGLKEEIAKAVPEVAPLNARESSLINASKMVEQRAAVDGNKNPIGLGAIPSTAARTAAFLGDRSALVKSLLARALNSSGNATAGAGKTAVIPLSFQEDALQRQRVIDAMMGAK